MAKESNSKNDSLKIVILIGIIVLIALLITIIVILLKKDKPVEERPRNVVVTEDNVEEVYQEISERATNRETAPGFYTVTMNPTWHFKAGEDVSYDAVVENVEGNTNDVYFDIVLESDESIVLYESPIIPRGGKLKDIAFDEKLEVGTYPCVVIYHLVDENQQSVSTLRVTLTIIVEE